MLRVGSVPYLVAQPLIYGLADRAGVELTFAPPSELARGLRAGRFDVALASSILAIEEPDLRLWREGPLIGADGPVRSVLLLLRPGLPGPAAVRRLELDPHSRTGRLLAAIVLQQRWLAEPEMVEATDGDGFAAGTDAVQRIGDPALRAAVEHPHWRPLDLAEEWKELTGLPFVFAGWIGRPGFDPAEAAGLLGPAADAGLERRAELAERIGVPGVDPGFLRRYLGEDVRYRLPAPTVDRVLAEFGRRSGLVTAGAEETGYRGDAGG
ncbi:MAG: hypothetical protein D6702_08450 [Planctomycetota bacterium]|nr:MAG: hypothetical protein D6702_08450 [Planctomycetota bacterium]